MVRHSRNFGLSRKSAHRDESGTPCADFERARTELKRPTRIRSSLAKEEHMPSNDSFHAEKHTHRETGAVLVVSMLMLVVLTVMGVAATHTTVLEILISSASRQKQSAFYAAEAGIEHAKIALGNLIDANTNNPNAGAGTPAYWDFLFENENSYPSVDEAEFKSPSFTQHVYLIQNQTFGDHSYTVTAGMPYAGGDMSLVWVRSYGLGPRGARSIIEVSYRGEHNPLPGSGMTITDYGGQDKQGAAKGSAGTDTEAIGAGDLMRNQVALNY